MLSDLRFSLRTLWANPGFTAVVVLTLALGIGANAAIFSVVNGVLLRPLPFPDSSSLVILCETHPSVADYCIASPPNVEDWSDQVETVETLGLGRGWPYILKTDGENYGIAGGIATPGFFQVLKLTPHLGRLFSQEDLETGRNQVVILSHSLWQSRFGADPDIVDRNLVLGNQTYSVIGVLQADVKIPGLEDVEMWAPLPFDPHDEENREWRGFSAFGRLAEGASLRSAQEEMDLVSQRLAAQYPATNEGWGISVLPLQEHVVGAIAPTLLIFLGAVGLVLLIGCANVANLMLARANRRRREFAVRSALGAERTRLIRLLMTENLLLSILGGIAGLLLAQWAVDVFIGLAPEGIPRLEEVGLDGPVLGFVLLLSVLTCLLFGLAPAMHASRPDLNAALKEGDQSGSSQGRLGLKGLLVVCEVGLALVLLIGAALLIQSFMALMRWDPDFEMENLTTVWVMASEGKYSAGDQAATLFSQAVEEIRSLPSVVSVGAASAGPMFGGIETEEFQVVGGDPSLPGEGPVARWFDVGPEYFQTLGLRLAGGRYFTEADTSGSTPVAMINETMADRYLSGQSPIGRQLTMNGRSMTIVGMVKDVPSFRVGEAVRPEIYWPYRQVPRMATFLVLRTTSDPAQIVKPARARLQELDPDLYISEFRTLEQRIQRQLVRPRFSMMLLGIFAASAILLAAIGIYGVISYSVANARREIGIRMALGASRRNILSAVVLRGLVPAAIGIALGVIAALGLTRLLATLLVGVAPSDPATFSTMALMLLLVALIACYIPARRATRTDPMVVLRQE